MGLRGGGKRDSIVGTASAQRKDSGMKPIIGAGTTRRLAMALALLVLLPLPTLAATIYVDNESCTISQAILSANAANHEDKAAYPNCESGTVNGEDTIVLTRDVRTNSTPTYLATSKILIDGRGRAFVGYGSTPRIAFATTGSGKLTIDNAKFTNLGPIVLDVRASGDVTFQNVEFYNSAGANAGVSLTASGAGVRIHKGVFRGNRLPAGETARVVSGPVDIYRSSFYDNRSSAAVDDGGAGYVIDGATIRSSTIGENRGASGAFAVNGGSLNNVTVAYNRSGGVTGGARVKNSILYGNSGADCAGSTLEGVNWVGKGGCGGGARTYTGRSPDIDDDLIFGSSRSALFPLEADGDAASVGNGCEFLDQWGRPFGPNPCDLGAHSTYIPGSGPRISVAAATALPTPTRVPAQPMPTIEPPVKGWVLFSDRGDIKSNEVDASGVGIAHIIELGFLTAIDVWSEVGWGVTACHTDYSNGNFVFLDAAGMPREAVTWPAAPHIEGMACTYIETPGTIVLLRADPWQESPTPTPDPNAPVFGPVPLEDCLLITRDMVNLRAEEWGDVLTIIPYETVLAAAASSEEFFKVTFADQEGWVHRDWVTITGGECGESE